LESLKAISVASQLMEDLTSATLDDPLADRYAKLGYQITPLDHDGEDFKMILNYLSKTIEPIKFNDTQFKVSLQEACLIDSPETPTLKDSEKMSNKTLISCGTRTSNLLACMKLGMPPPVIQAPVSGYVFRVGLYCSNSSAREAQYGFTVVDRPEGYLILAVVASGDEILELTEPHEDVSNYKKRHVAIKGLGRTTTDEKEYVSGTKTSQCRVAR
jgi:poly [ADP-ribose] polymerase